MANKITVYRVENENGLGPYTDGALAVDWADTGSDYTDETHPGPVEEGFDMTPEWVCGFSSMDQLLDWFSGNELDNLERLGMYIEEYQVDKSCVQFGTRQVVFIKD